MPPDTSGARNPATTVDGQRFAGGWFDSSGPLVRTARLRRAETAGPGSTLRARRPVLSAIALFGLLIGFLVALVALLALISDTAPGGNATAIELMIQILVLVGAVLLLAGRMARRS
jgi:hypothetical protein